MVDSDTLLNSATLRGDFLELLDRSLPEQKYQDCLEANTQLIPREFIQNHGMHFDLVLRKLGFGADYKTDFFYISKSSADWNLIFVENEKPQSWYFRGSGIAFSSEFSSALQQIGTWRAWLLEPANLQAFLVSIEPILHPMVMRSNPSHPKFVLVHGRRKEFEGNEQRRRLIHAQERDDFKILSFDSLVEGLAQKHRCYVGVRHNVGIELRGDEIIAPELFGWAEPTQFLVSAKMRDTIRSGAPSGTSIHRNDGTEFVNAFHYFADRVRVKDKEI